jgi:hypothetical protein
MTPKKQASATGVISSGSEVVQDLLRLLRLTGLVTASWGCFQVAVADLIPPDPIGGATADCNHGTPGWTKTKPLEWLSASQLGSLNFDLTLQSIITNQNPAFPGTWKFQISSQASGTEAFGIVEVQVYEPFDEPGACEHGASLLLDLPILFLPPGQELKWMQLYSYTVSPNSVPIGTPLSVSDIVDPPIGYTLPGFTADRRPFYYNVSGSGDGPFADSPSFFPWDSDVPHSGDESFLTLITSWDGSFDAGGDNLVTVYGGVTWGYTYFCKIPEPSVLSTFGVGCLFLVFAAGRRRRS